MQIDTKKIIKCSKYLRHGFSYGRTGVCHLYKEDNPRSKQNALKRAIKDQQEDEAKQSKAQKIVPFRLLFS